MLNILANKHFQMATGFLLVFSQEDADLINNSNALFGTVCFLSGAIQEIRDELEARRKTTINHDLILN